MVNVLLVVIVKITVVPRRKVLLVISNPNSVVETTVPPLTLKPNCV
jgi:hypothetical protein